MRQNSPAELMQDYLLDHNMETIMVELHLSMDDVGQALERAHLPVNEQTVTRLFDRLSQIARRAAHQALNEWSGGGR